MICKETIKQRKKVYGNNLPDISISWSEYLGIEIKPKDVAMMMALMKHTRVVRIDGQLLELKIKNDLDNEESNILINSLEDSKKDKSNYLFIATNYDEYLEM